MTDLRFAVLGTGWWSTFQIPAWFEVGGVQLVAVYNRTVSKAEKVAQQFDVPRVYGNVEELFQKEELDFVDIITDVAVHAPMVYLAAKHKVPVICQKPMAPDYETCLKMVQTCRQAGILFMIHENLRWHTPVRALKGVLDEGLIGEPFRARIEVVGYSPNEFIDQPFLRTLEHLVIADLGSHVLDVARFLFGEPHSLYCQHVRTRDDIKGEDAASVTLKFDNLICSCEMSNATRTEWNHYPDMFAFIEGTKGSVEVAPDYYLRVTTDDGTQVQRCLPPVYPWATYDQIAWHASIVDCNANLLNSIKTGVPAETNGDDNLKTMRLVYSSYDSAARNQVITLD